MPSTIYVLKYIYWQFTGFEPVADEGILTGVQNLPSNAEDDPAC